MKLDTTKKKGHLTPMSVEMIYNNFGAVKNGELIDTLYDPSHSSIKHFMRH